MGDEYLPLAYLNAWEYCPRRFYLEYVLGEMQDNEHVIRGRHLHQHINQAGTVTVGETQVHRQQWVWHDHLQINGVIDAVEERHGHLVPLEHKKGRMGRHLNDHYQLCAAALCLEAMTGRPIAWGEVFYHGSQHRQRVEFTPTLRLATETAIRAAQAAARGPMPAPIEHQAKCKDCSLQSICLPKEVRQLRESPT